MTQHIIIGNGIAANTAAETIRKHDPQCDIRMFTREPYDFYYIPALPEYIAGEKNIAGITLHTDRWYQDQNITLHRTTDISTVDPDRKTVTASNGTSYRWDRLLLATGGYSFIPPISGADNEDVFSLRTLADAERIKARAAAAQELVLIGGGLLGLEAGNGLRKAGLKVTVVEFFPRLLPRQMDSAGAHILQQQMERMGFAFYLGAKTKAITRQGPRLSVNLESGEQLAADMVLISAGVRPEVTLAKSLGLAIDKGVKVNDELMTELPDVYAAGDLIEHRGRFYGIWPASLEQGRIAGANMAGQSMTYGGTVPANTLKVVGIDLTAAGDIDADGNLEAIVNTDPQGSVYRKFVVQDGRLVGAILFGDNRGSEHVLKAIQTGADVSAVKDRLAEPGFDFSSIG